MIEKQLRVGGEVIPPKYCIGPSNAHLWSDARHEKEGDDVFSIVHCLHKGCFAISRLKIS